MNRRPGVRAIAVLALALTSCALTATARVERDKPIEKLGWLDRRFAQDGKPLCDWYQTYCTHDVRGQVLDLLRENPASAPRMEGYGTKAALATAGGIVMGLGVLSMLSAADTDRKATIAVWAVVGGGVVGGVSGYLGERQVGQALEAYNASLPRAPAPVLPVYAGAVPGPDGRLRCVAGVAGRY
jgi:hypothetical protein